MITLLDREIDAINEPNRPIPSGAISEEQVIQQIWALWISGESNCNYSNRRPIHSVNLGSRVSEYLLRSSPSDNYPFTLVLT